MNNQTININPNDATDVVCECGSMYYVPVFHIKRISALLSPTGQVALIPVQVFKCFDCGLVFEGE